MRKFAATLFNIVSGNIAISVQYSNAILQYHAVVWYTKKDSDYHPSGQERNWSNTHLLK